MAKKMKPSATEDDSSSSSRPRTASSSDDDSSREGTARHRRRRSRARRNTSKNKRSCSQGKAIKKLLEVILEEMQKQSNQATKSKEEVCKQLDNVREEMCQQSKQATESNEEICKQLEKVQEEIAEIRNNLCKQWELHTNGTSGDDFDAPIRSQSNQVQPPRYRLVFKSGVADKIEKGQNIEISVALVDGYNDQTVENGPLASATVELVVVNAEFNQHNNQYNWSREDFESNIKKARQGNSATVVDQPVKSIVSDGRFNLVHGFMCHRGSKIFSNSSNKKVRLGVMIVSPTEERVLEGLSNPFFVRGHDRPARQSNLRHNGSNTQRHVLVDNSYQVQNGLMPNLQNPLSPNSTQTGEIRLNTATRLQYPFLGNTTMLSSGMLNIDGEPQLSFLGNTPMLSAEPSTSQEQRASIQYQHFPHWPVMAEAATNNQRLVRLAGAGWAGWLAVREKYCWLADWLVAGLIRCEGKALLAGWTSSQPNKAQIGMQFSMDQRVLPVQLLWDRPNVEPIKRRWNLFDKLMTPPQEHFGSLSLASIQKSVLHKRQRSGVVIEQEPDDSDEERPLKKKWHSKYQLRFVNKVCETYYTRDQIKADDGNLLKVALFDENNTKITSGPLSSASVEVLALHGDFNCDGQDYWTSEEFNRSVVCPPPGEEASSVLGGDRILVLVGGEACLGDAFFQTTSFCARTGKFKMGVMLASAQEERIQEGISEPFQVMSTRASKSPCMGSSSFDDPNVVEVSLAAEGWAPSHHNMKRSQLQQATTTSNINIPPPSAGESNLLQYGQAMAAEALSEGGGSCDGSTPAVQANAQPRSMSDSERSKLLRIPKQEPWLRCPRCGFTSTKFCYFNNFCRNCQRLLDTRRRPPQHPRRRRAKGSVLQPLLHRHQQQH